ncbi:MAG: hypothetical protein JNL08_15675 [Planctomycetes bacterium]|nr:hypothetical protein [Planctomycetota bacterium]
MPAEAAAPPHGGAASLVGATALATLLLGLVLQRHGLAFGPDAWTSWTASVSLLEGRGYCDAHGLVVHEWPPLYSLWLAAVQAVAGVSVASVRLADAIAAAVFAALACAAALRQVPEVRERWPVALAAATPALLALRGPSSEHVMHAALFALLLAVQGWQAAARPGPRAVALAAGALALAAAVATRHAALVFVPAAVLLLASTRCRPRRERAVAAAVIAGPALLLAAWIRAAFEQGAATTLFSSTREPLATAATMLRAVGEDLAPFPFGIAAWLFSVVWFARAARHPDTPDHRGAVAFVVVALLGTFALFQLVHVADEPKGRFVRFAGVIVGTLLVARVAALPQPRWRVALLLVLLLPNVLRAGKHVVVGRQGCDTVTEHGGESWLPLRATWRPGLAAGTVTTDGCVAVEAPLFRWQRQRMQVERPR